MKYILTEAYSYKELSDSIKLRITSELMSDVIDMRLKDSADDFIHKLEDIGFIEPKIRYSLNYCQGDGVSFTFTDINTEKLENTLIMCNATSFRDYKHIKQVFGLVNARKVAIISRISSYFGYRYCHNNTVDLEGFLDNSILKTNNSDFIQDKVDTFICYFLRPLYLGLCNEFEQRGYGIVDLAYNFEEVQEFCETNEYLFNKYGDLI